LQPSPGAHDPFFALLTKHGKLLIYHYTIVDSVVSHKKYGRHLQTYDREISSLCRDRLRPGFNEICLAALSTGKAGKLKIERETSSFDTTL
jgi:hypothetical protein